MPCLVCGSTTTSDPCSFHPGKPNYTQSTDGRNDHRDVYRWSCCGQYALSEIKAGSDVSPEHAPGCITATTHLTAAPILISHSSSRSDLAHASGASLRDMGFDVALSPMDAPSRADHSGYACVAIIPEEADALSAIDMADGVRASTRPPWVIVFSARDAVHARTQTSSLNRADEVSSAISRGVRMHHGHLETSPFNVFLSYRRADTPVAAAINKRLSSWWDQHVLSPGVDWASEIDLGIRACSLFVVLFRGDVPPESYVWRELDLAIKYERSIAILAFEDEGQAALLRCGISRDMLEWCELRAPWFPDREAFLVGRHSSGERSILYFRRLGSQLQWPPNSERADEYDTSLAISFLNTLRDFPRYRFYSNEPWTQVWDLMRPIER